MKIHYKGTYNGDPASLPQREHPDAVQFREPDNMKKLAIALNLAAGVLMLALLGIVWAMSSIEWHVYWIALALHLVLMLPHEFLHAICFRGDVEVYTNLKQGMLFVSGTEDFSKAGFVWMSLLPNLLFGFVPFVIFLLFPKLSLFGVLGALNIGAGAGDYMNVFNCLNQVPKGAKVYNSGFHTYWHR